RWGQGYHFSRPCTARELDELLARSGVKGWTEPTAPRPPARRPPPRGAPPLAALRGGGFSFRRQPEGGLWPPPSPAGPLVAAAGTEGRSRRARRSGSPRSPGG